MIKAQGSIMDPKAHVDSKVSNIPTQTVEELIDEVYEDLGGFGKLQWYAYFTLTGVMVAVWFWLYMMANLVQTPAYLCKNEQGEFVSCEASDICDADLPESDYKIDWSSTSSIHNWFVKLNLLCMPVTTYFVSIVYFLGQATTAILFARISDMYGRKKLLQIASCVCSLLWIGILVTKNPYVMIVLLFLYGTQQPILN